jgi:hypothetical protein
MNEPRPNDLDRQKLIRDLAHITKILDEKVHSLESKLEECQALVKALTPNGDTASVETNETKDTKG